MKKVSQTQTTVEGLQNIQQQIAELASQGINVPDNVKMLNDPALTRDALEDIRTESGDVAQISDDFYGVANQAVNAFDYKQQQLQNIEQGIEANMKPFNLKKAQQMIAPEDALENPQGMDTEVGLASPLDDATLDTSPEMEGDLASLQLSSVDQLIDQFLDVSDYANVRTDILDNVPAEIGDTVDSVLKTYYETDWDIVDDPRTKKIEMVIPVWEHLNPSVKAETAQPGIIEGAEFRTLSFIKDVTNSIKKLAEADSKKNKTFNLKKQAQAKTIENVIMYGPGEKRFDPFLRQPVSDWNIVERNKGFGFVVDDVWNINWEAIWRGTIMDKYSRPYRDTKTGEWVGGYIQKRFEVDKWIPEGNNLQLLPGQKRKPYLPETRSTEARLEAMREKEGEARGYKPVTEGKPFNWKEAQAKKKLTKISQRQDITQSYTNEYYVDIKRLAQEVVQTSSDPFVVATSYVVDEGRFSPEDIMFTIGGYAREDFNEEFGRPGDLEPSYRKPIDLDKQIRQAAIKKVGEDIEAAVYELEETEQPGIIASSKKKR